MGEGLIDYFQEKLDNSNDLPHVILSLFYSKLVNLPVSLEMRAMMAKLVRLYGKQRVFNAIVSVYGVDDFYTTGQYELLTYFCNKQVSPKTHIKDLTQVAEDNINSFEKIKKMKYKPGHLLEEKDNG